MARRGTRHFRAVPGLPLGLQCLPIPYSWSERLKGEGVLASSLAVEVA
jgi:hypothetical protein